MRVAIHQPNFMPWLPFFKKMQAADLFVIMIHCQWSKGGYQNRFNLGDEWHTMRVSHGLEPIHQKQYLSPLQDWERIKAAFPGTPLGSFDEWIVSSLWLTNMAIIETAAARLGIGAEITTDRRTDATGSQRLLEICLEHDATTYVSGPSGRKYLDVELFERAGVGVEFFDAEPADKVPLVQVLR